MILERSSEPLTAAITIDRREAIGKAAKRESIEVSGETEFLETRHDGGNVVI